MSRNNTTRAVRALAIGVCAIGTILGRAAVEGFLHLAGHLSRPRPEEARP